MPVQRPRAVAGVLEHLVLQPHVRYPEPDDYPLPRDNWALVAAMCAEADPMGQYGMVERVRRAQQLYRARMLRRQADADDGLLV